MTHDTTTGVQVTCNDGIGGSNGGYNVLDNALCQAVGHSLNVVLLGSGQSCLIQPLDILGVISVHLAIYSIRKVEGKQNDILRKQDTYEHK